MKKIFISILLLLPVALSAQYDYAYAATKAKMIRLDSLATDSAHVCTLPAGVMLTRVMIVVDSAITGSDGDSIKIGIRGERPLHPFRFADFPYDSLAEGTRKQLSHYTYRQSVSGYTYTYDMEIAVTATDADVYYPIVGLEPFPVNDFEISATGAMIVKPYRDGCYDIRFGASLSASKANVDAHGEIFINDAGYDYISYERTISTASQIGSAFASGGASLAEGDSIRFHLKSDTPATTYTVHHAQLVACRTRDESPYTTDAEREIWLYTRATGGQVRVFVEYIELY